MQLNTAQFIDLGRRVHRAFGSWKAAREAAVKTDDGVYRIRRETLDEAEAETLAGAGAGAAAGAGAGAGTPRG